MKLTALSYVLFISFNTFSQNDKVILKFSPLATIDFVNFPAIQVGIENKLSEKFSLYNEVGMRYTKYFFRQADTSFIPTNGFRLKSEIRYYFQKDILKTIFQRGIFRPSRPAYRHDHYLGFNTFFISDHHNASSRYIGKDSIEHTDNYGVKKQVFGFNFVLGNQKSMGSRFLLDWYIGVGARFRFITTLHQELVYHKDLLITPIDLNANSVTEDTEVKGGNSAAPNLTMGVRLGYRL